MEIKVNIKSLGFRYGTSGWLKNQIDNGNIWFEESNDYYIPIWSSCIPQVKTHGLVMRDDKNCALIAYRNFNGEYKYNIDEALGDDEYINYWCLNLTEVAKDILCTICKDWIAKMELEEQ